MENNITIVDAIKTVLQDSSEGMTSQEIYNKIVERKLYELKHRKRLFMQSLGFIVEI